MWNLFDLDKEYTRCPAIKREDIQKVLQWIQIQPHLPKITEREAMLFYAAAGYSVEATKQLIDVNMTCRTHFDDFFDCFDVDTPRMKRVFKTVAGFHLPKRTPEGHAVVMAKLIDKDPSNFNFADSVKIYVVGQDVILQEIGIVPGLIFVIDLTDATFAHLTRVGILQLKKVLYYLQEAIPVRIQSLHFINIVPFMDKILALMSPFMKKELMDILHVHASLDTFYEHVPREILPEELGGSELHSKSLCENFYNKLRENRLELIELNLNRRINEKLRPGNMKNPSDIFGTAGNFKKLDID